MSITETPPSAREVAGDILRYMTIKGVPIETIQQAFELVKSEFEEGE
ncbi:hypothetical protein NZD89_09220 [Alicyclobacillus fastidiosus]|uniref:Uncharacterized protein n=1 Tax=Alicyclobacillus fastidiosus TaxID=392011 RepID=A0ABY6ZM17_9BACL|nr:hypothetical protein [Alicyclobacillus fastidiosus]WAH43537.1 hypothetical protein NZD89_09220 [Alicyclobacillus fastidiosus]GMA59710.1 hypothetical protein GCM10025859_01500 [Alicyclobacillus fastidiosus]GMA65559.1 hypothetical protein GCM10025859_59990 [Alicyclobacillus fastidiosus]